MALELKLELKEIDFINNKFIITDKTGLESPTNPGGYGFLPYSTNLSKVKSDNEIWYFAAGVSKDGNILVSADHRYINDLEFITPQTNFLFENIDIALQLNNDIENGLYNFFLIVEPFTYGDPIIEIAFEHYVFNTKELEDKINAEFAKRLDFCSNNTCECNKSLLTLWSYYRALCAALEIQNIPMVEYLSEQINKIID